jgi:hypothetical protein
LHQNLRRTFCRFAYSEKTDAVASSRQAIDTVFRVMKCSSIYNIVTHTCYYHPTAIRFSLNDFGHRHTAGKYYRIHLPNYRQLRSITLLLGIPIVDSPKKMSTKFRDKYRRVQASRAIQKSTCTSRYHTPLDLG